MILKVERVSWKQKNKQNPFYNNDFNIEVQVFANGETNKIDLQVLIKILKLYNGQWNKILTSLILTKSMSTLLSWHHFYNAQNILLVVI